MGLDFKQQFEELMQNTIIAPNEDYNAKMQPINDLVRDNTPKQLFRFRTFSEFTIDAFWKDYIYHSRPVNFNDPHDCLVYVDKPSLLKIFVCLLNLSYGFYIRFLVKKSEYLSLI